MKYIRTKDGVFERMFPNEEQRISFDHKTIEPAYFTTKYEWVAKREVIKKANTIKELLDEFVCIGSAEYQKYIKHSLKEALQKKEWLKRGGYDCNIYGAIWVQLPNGAWRLEPFAKVNEKGELELI